jgi:pilus assembly protein Flp/PilA
MQSAANVRAFGIAVCKGHLGTRKDHIMRLLLCNFAADDKGAAAIEYGLLAAGIAVAIIAVITALGTNLNTTFTDVSTAMK